MTDMTEALTSNATFSKTQLRLLLLLGLSVLINYVDRGNLSIAAPMLKDELHLRPDQLGLLLSAFFWTYALCQPLAGWLVDRYDVSWVLAGGFFLWSAATAVTGFAGSFVVLFAIRLVLGVGESVAYPSYSKIFERHFAQRQKGKVNSVIASGSALGSASGALGGGILMASFGWRPFFVVLGVVTLLWLPAWLRWKPQPTVAQRGGAVYVPTVAAIFAQRSAWGTFLGLFFGNYVLYFLISWLPYYLIRERNFSAKNMAFTGGATYVAMALGSALTGWLSDRWLASGASASRVRKTAVGGGLLCSSLCVAVSVVADPFWTVVLLIVGGAFYGVASSNAWAISQTISGPEAAGRWAGCKNFFGNLAGVAAPALTGMIVTYTGQFFWAFVLTGVIGVIGSAIWVFVVGPVRPVVWAGAAAVPPPLVSV